MNVTVPHHQQGPALSSWAQRCHPERSEGSRCRSRQTLRGVSPERSEGAQSLPLSEAKGWQAFSPNI